MTTKLIKTLAVASVVSFASCDQAAEVEADVTTENVSEQANTEVATSDISIDDVSYSLGVNIANDFNAREISNLNVESFKAAIDAVIDQTPHKLAPEQWG